MEKSRKDLFTISAAAGVLVLHQLYSLIQAIIGLGAQDSSELTDPAMQAILPIINVLMVVGGAISVAFVALVAIKGVLESKNPSSARFHILVAQILGALYVVAAIGQVGNLFSGKDLPMNLVNLAISAVYIVIMFFYASRAKKVRVTE